MDGCSAPGAPQFYCSGRVTRDGRDLSPLSPPFFSGVPDHSRGKRAFGTPPTRWDRPCTSPDEAIGPRRLTKLYPISRSSRGASPRIRAVSCSGAVDPLTRSTRVRVGDRGRNLWGSCTCCPETKLTTGVVPKKTHERPAPAFGSNSTCSWAEIQISSHSVLASPLCSTLPRTPVTAPQTARPRCPVPGSSRHLGTTTLRLARVAQTIARLFHCCFGSRSPPRSGCGLDR